MSQGRERWHEQDVSPASSEQIPAEEWKMEVQRLADGSGLSMMVCHFPPGTSKWNKVEHRLFSFISSNWRGEPLRDYETIVRLIATTTTAWDSRSRADLTVIAIPSAARSLMTRSPRST